MAQGLCSLAYLGTRCSVKFSTENRCGLAFGFCIPPKFLNLGTRLIPIITFSGHTGVPVAGTLMLTAPMHKGFLMLVGNLEV